MIGSIFFYTHSKTKEIEFRLCSTYGLTSFLFKHVINEPLFFWIERLALCNTKCLVQPAQILFTFIKI